MTAQTSPAALRNRDPILAVLRRVLPASGTVLEIASGSGEHAIHFAAALPSITWQPSDVADDARRSVAAHARTARLPNLLAPIELDVTEPVWRLDRADAIVSINMIHIAPWQAAEGLIAGAERILPCGAPLVLYGPFRETGRITAPSNEAFDASLKSRNAAWGLRQLDEVIQLAASHGLRFVERVEMPANNLCVLFRR
ncbi:MAG: SAM-dependent methyltransferase [Rhodospirillales bacterium]|jgi:cyclopropane fatty-acyl-phospholipid synthase-like methyltransferase|nr:SAM-dependent methyltransferase [Rhodospirillales bacterium]